MPTIIANASNLTHDQRRDQRQNHHNTSASSRRKDNMSCFVLSRSVRPPLPFVRRAARPPVRPPVDSIAHPTDRPTARRSTSSLARPTDRPTDCPSVRPPTLAGPARAHFAPAAARSHPARTHVVQDFYDSLLNSNRLKVSTEL